MSELVKRDGNSDVSQFELDLDSGTSKSLRSLTTVGGVNHSLKRVVGFSSNPAVRPRVVEQYIEGYGFIRITSRMSKVHKVILEMIIKLTGKNFKYDRDSETIQFTFDMSKLRKMYGTTNNKFIPQKIKELGGYKDPLTGEVFGTFIEVWKGSEEPLSDAARTSSSGIEIKSGYCNGQNEMALIRREEQHDPRAENLLKSKGSRSRRSDESQYMFHLMISAEWLSIVSATGLLKMATLEGLKIISKVKNSRLAVIIDYMTEQKGSDSKPLVRSFSFLVDHLEIFEGATRKARSDFLKAIIDEQETYNKLGIYFNSGKQIFYKTSDPHFSVKKVD